MTAVLMPVHNFHLSTPDAVAAAARQILNYHSQRSLSFAQYRLVQAGEGIVISSLIGRGIILMQRGSYLESNLHPCDYAWFTATLQELESLPAEVGLDTETHNRMKVYSRVRMKIAPTLSPLQRHQNA